MSQEEFLTIDCEKDIAMMPYMSHELRMTKAYQREKRWKVLFFVSNCLWIVGAILSLVVR